MLGGALCFIGVDGVAMMDNGIVAGTGRGQKSCCSTEFEGGDKAGSIFFGDATLLDPYCLRRCLHVGVDMESGRVLSYDVDTEE